MKPAAPVTRMRTGAIVRGSMAFPAFPARLADAVDLLAVALERFRPGKVRKRLRAPAETRERRAEVVLRVGLVRGPASAQGGDRLPCERLSACVVALAEPRGRLVGQRDAVGGLRRRWRRRRRK